MHRGLKNKTIHTHTHTHLWPVVTRFQRFRTHSNLPFPTEAYSHIRCCHVPPGKNQSACWMMGSIIPTICSETVVIISVIFLRAQGR